MEDTLNKVQIDNVFLSVFKSLSLTELCLGARRVCKKWHALSYDMSLWKRVDLRCMSRYLSDMDLVNLLAEIGDHVEYLDIRGCLLISLTFSSNKVKCPHLKEIDVSDTNISNESLLELYTNLDKYPRLEWITCLAGEMDRRERYYTLCLEAYSAKRKLKSISIPYLPQQNQIDNEQETNIAMLKISALYSDLEHLDISGADIPGSTLIKLCEKNPGIRTLRIVDCLFSSGTVSESVSKLTSLTNLDISCTAVRDEELGQIATAHPNLERVNVSSNNGITDVGIIQLAETCKRLSHFVANDSIATHGTITDGALEVIAENCPLLEEISVVFCPNVSDAGIIAIASKCRKIKVIDVVNCGAITDKSFLAMSSNCSELLSLKASNCMKITGVGVCDVISKCRKLKELEVDTCHAISDICLATTEQMKNASTKPEEEEDFKFPNCLIKSPCRLRVLDLNYCSKIDTACVIHIACYCVTLRNLSLRACHLITDNAIEAVAQKCVLLNVLDISGSTVNRSKLTSASISALADHAHNLVMLSIARTSFNTRDVLNVIEKCQTLKSLQVQAGAQLKVRDVMMGAGRLRGRCRTQAPDDAEGPIVLRLRPLKYPC